MGLMRFAWIFLIVLTIAACSSQDGAESAKEAGQATEADDPAARADATEPAIDDLSEEDLRALARDPEALREIMADPQRRQAVRERMRELRQQRRAESGREDPRAAMRERAQRHRQTLEEGGDRQRGRRSRTGRWWENDVIARNVGLSPEQVGDIGTAHDQLTAAARESRQQLAQVASSMQEALKASDRDRLVELVDARQEALQVRAQAEAEWMKRLLEILEDEQMTRLAEERPELVSALLAPVR
ncbi:hypothetical protein DZC52_04655 [Wenzhouxiangella sediminis]|uniref:DUF3106 domain-containing protein n=2 Tax=Wenzhouxiangella sediminis TaxID=1792836 RepID=A0A3E1KAG1_9GAMM|nr:hypothetical protein DZC52_04655 [Wenzhouxiangella sediminis]